MDSPQAKRKKFFTKGEIVEKLKEKNCQISRLSEEICEELCPFDCSQDEEILIEDRLERMKEVTKCLASKVYKLHKAFKERKFLHNPEHLDEKLISCSQYSVLQSESSGGDSQQLTDSQDHDSEFSLNSQGPNLASDLNSEGSTVYKKKPLNKSMTQFSRTRRVAEKREILKEWAMEEGVSPTELLGYFLYLENYHTGKIYNYYSHKL